MYTYCIGVGSNMGDRGAYINGAVQALRERTDIRSVKVSSLMETAPWGLEDQPSFLNGVIIVKAVAEPDELLSVLQSLEQQAGRQRTVHWGPRTLDLDILWCQDGEGKPVERAEDALRIPHPYFWDRLFVLQPLAELYPSFTYGGESIQRRIEVLRSQ